VGDGEDGAVGVTATLGVARGSVDVDAGTRGCVFDGVGEVVGTIPT
jgi:hypothetical protein